MSFNPQQLAEAIQRQRADFRIDYQPDHRQAIANSWPQSLDDAYARADWGWNPQIGLTKLVEDMLLHIGELAHEHPRACLLYTSRCV